MKRRQLYLAGGILCLAISFTIFVYGHVVSPLLTRGRNYFSGPTPAPNPTPKSLPPNIAGRTTKAKPPKRTEQQPEPIKAKEPSVNVPSEGVARATPEYWATPQEPAVEPFPTWVPASTPQTRPPTLTPQECDERIEAVSRNQYVYIPPECQPQYRAWKAYKAEQQRSEQQRQRQAERDKRNKEDADRRKRQEIFRGIDTIIQRGRRG